MRNLHHSFLLAAATGLFAGAAGLGAMGTTTALAADITPQVELDRPVITENRDTRVHVIVRFDIPEDIAPDRHRPNINLALVLDRSGSMDARGKMDYLKKAARMVVDRMGRGDRLAVVEYDDRITLMWPSEPLESKRALKRLISQLYPRGATNLAGGMDRGIEEIEEYAGSYDVTRVLLLSDGLANRGITSPREIRRMARQARRDGVRVTTLGLGIDYNEDLMQGIAEASGGNYYFIESPNQMARIFERELNSLFGTVAKDVELILRTHRAVRRVTVLGQPQERDNDRIRLRMEDLYAGETRSVVLALDVDPDRLGNLDLGRLQFTYRDVATGRDRTFERDLSVEVTQDVERARASINRQADVEATLAETEEEHRQSLKLFEEGRVKEANEKVQAMRKRLTSRNEELQDKKLEQKLEALEVEQRQMDAAAEAPAVKSEFLKKSKQRLYQANRGKRSLYNLKPGDKGYEVERLQEALKEKGYLTAPADGTYDDDVNKAVREFQRANGLDANGVAGPETLEKLDLY